MNADEVTAIVKAHESLPLADLRTRLFSCTSKIDNWPHKGHRYDGVYVCWWVHERPPGYADQFAGLFDADDPYSRGVIDELFTESEAQEFAAFMAEHYGTAVTIDPYPLPVEQNMAPTGAIAVGGDCDFHMLSKEPRYTLALPVWGYYRIEGYYDHPERIGPMDW